ncbi:MAG: hypothetical protein IMW94_04365 [Thermoanaerobacter sp.]|nr:hypothetical protein [Thermoanaerobacter sp.]
MLKESLIKFFGEFFLWSFDWLVRAALFLPFAALAVLLSRPGYGKEAFYLAFLLFWLSLLGAFSEKPPLEWPAARFWGFFAALGTAVYGLGYLLPFLRKFLPLD